MTDVLVAVVATALMASMGLLQYGEERVNAEAVIVAAELRIIAEAARAHEASTGNWPPDGGRGEVPAALQSFMVTVEFTGRRRALEWDKFEINPTGSGHIAGITLSAADRRLLDRVIVQMKGEYPYFVAGRLVTWVLPERAPPGGPPASRQGIPGG